MGKVLMLILILFICAVLWCLPLYLVVNFVCWVFHIAFHLSLLQAFALCLLASVIRSLFFKKEDK